MTCLFTFLLSHFVRTTRFSKTSGRSFLVPECRSDVLYISDPCEHQGKNNNNSGGGGDDDTDVVPHGNEDAAHGYGNAAHGHDRQDGIIPDGHDGVLLHGHGDVAHGHFGRDNRSLVDDNTAQKLSADDIHRMRTECASGKDIIEALVANSATFHTKTAYSQEKYKRKKQKKYAPSFVLRRPSARRICEAYFSKTPQKIGFLRMDTMSLMLSLANVGSYGEVLVMDMVGGLLTAAVAERIGGFGSVLSVYYTNKPPPLDIVGLLNLNNMMACRVFRSSIWEISNALKTEASNDNDALKKGVMIDNDAQKAIVSDLHPESQEKNDTEKGVDNEKRNDAINAADGESHMDVQEEKPKENESDASRCQKDAESMVLGNGDNCNVNDTLVLQDQTGTNHGKHAIPRDDIEKYNTKVSETIRPGRSPSSVEVFQWSKHGFTSLLVAALEVDPWSIIQVLLPLLSPSSPFVIYHRYLEPLAQCMHELQASKMAIALEIVEPWLREYQVLPSRTHPHMQMNASGGYILTGVKLAPQ